MTNTALLLDTCVLIKLSNTKTSKVVGEILSHYPTLDVHISIMTCYEFARTAKNRHEALKKSAFLQQWNFLPTDMNVMKFATVYYNILSQWRTEDDGRLRFHMKNQFSDADIVIGATAMMLNLLIATFDANDFPRPLFDEYASYDVRGTKFYILKPRYCSF